MKQPASVHAPKPEVSPTIFLMLKRMQHKYRIGGKQGARPRDETEKGGVALGERRLKRLYANKSFLSISLLSFLLFLVLASIVLSFSFQMYLEETKRKAVVLHQERLNSYANQINFQYNKIVSSLDQLLSDPMVLKWVNAGKSEEDFYLSKQLLERLKYVSVLNDAVYSLEVFNPKNGIVLSHYYGYFTSRREDERINPRRELYTDFVKSANMREVHISTETINASPMPTLILVSSVPVYHKNGVIGIVIEAPKLMPDNIALTENLFMLATKNPDARFANTTELHIPEERVGTWIASLLERDAEGVMHEIVVDGQMYYSAYRSVINNEFKLLMLVPEVQLVENLQSFTEYFRFAFLLILVLSVFSSFLVYRIARQPIRRIVKNISSKLNSPIAHVHAGDDLQYLDRTFDLIIKQNTEFENALREHKEMVEETMIRNLIYGRLDEDTRRFFRHHFPEGGDARFVILIFNMDTYLQKNAAHVMEQFDKLMCAKLTDAYGGCWLRTGHRQYTVWVRLRHPEQRKDLLQDVQNAMEQIRKDYGVTLTAGVSSIKRGIEDVSECYNEAQEAVKYKAVLGQNRIIDSARLNLHKGRLGSFSIQEGQQLMRKLRTAGEQEILETLDRMIEEKKHQFSIEMLHAFLLYISSCIVQVGIEHNISPEDLVDNELFKAIVESDSFEEIRKHLENQCKVVVAVRNSKQKKFKKLSGELAIRYIEENYNKPISLEIVAAELNMSPSYLSRIVKQEVGENFNAYLNKLRVDRAIKLLGDGAMTVKEVAAAVGYFNEHTFIRNFKSITGRTPADYRNSARKT